MENQAYLSFRSELIKNARNTNTPIFAVFELTGRCNLNCKMCYIHTTDNAALRAGELTTEQWKKIIDEAYACGLVFAQLTGGECTLREDFREIYQHLYDKGIRIIVTTNGTLLTEDNVAFLQEHRPERVQISLYGANEDDYEAVTGCRFFQRVTSGLFRLQEAGIDFTVHITPSKNMAASYKSIISFCKSHDIVFTVGDHLIDPVDGSSNMASKLTSDKYIEILKYEAQARGRQLIPCENPPKAGNNGTVVLPPSGLTCNAGKCSAYIDYRGFMHPCVEFRHGAAPVLTHGYKKAWEQVNKNCTQIRMPSVCVGCAYEAHCNPCPAVRFRAEDSTQCNPEQCRFMERKCAEGLIRLKQEQSK